MAERKRKRKISEKLKETLTKPSVSEESEKQGGQSPSTSQENKSENTEESKVESQDRPPSPEPNCSICLSGLENKSFTDSCFHQFCFVCLLEWSKVKAVCPLCKQPFKSIIHNVRSLEDYDQYHLLTAEERYRQERRRFRYRTTMDGPSWLDRNRQRAIDIGLPTRTTARSLWREGRQAATSAFRQRVYERGMFVGDSNGRATRYRDVTPQFFSHNPAVTHRLVPWLNRELNVLLRNDDNRVTFVLELILDLVKRFDIKSPDFKQHLSSFLNRRTDHFIHEFYNFARSPYDMIAYDRHAIYEDPRNAPVQELSSDSDLSDRDEIIRNANNVMVDLVNEPVNPVVLDTGVIVLDSDDEELRPSTSGDPVAVASQETSAGTSARVAPDAPEQPSRSSSPDSLLTGMYNDLFVNNAGTATSGWDSPLPSTSSLWDISTMFRNFMQQSSVVAPVFGPSTSQAVAPSTRRRRRRSRSSAETIDSDVDSIASSHSSDLMVTGFEKPWDERSPIHLSSGDENGNEASTSRKKSKKRKHGKDSKDRKRDKHSRDSGARSNNSEHRSKKSKHKNGKKDRRDRRGRFDNVDQRDVGARRDRPGDAGSRDVEIRGESPPIITQVVPPTINLTNQTVTISSPDSDSDRRRPSRYGSSYACAGGSQRGRGSEFDAYSAVSSWLDDIPSVYSSDATNPDSSADAARKKDRKGKEKERKKHEENRGTSREASGDVLSKKSKSSKSHKSKSSEKSRAEETCATGRDDQFSRSASHGRISPQRRSKPSAYRTTRACGSYDRSERQYHRSRSRDRSPNRGSRVRLSETRRRQSRSNSRDRQSRFPDRIHDSTSKTRTRTSRSGSRDYTSRTLDRFSRRSDTSGSRSRDSSRTSENGLNSSNSGHETSLSGIRDRRSSSRALEYENQTPQRNEHLSRIGEKRKHKDRNPNERHKSKRPLIPRKVSSVVVPVFNRDIFTAENCERTLTSDPSSPETRRSRLSSSRSRDRTGRVSQQTEDYSPNSKRNCDTETSDAVQNNLNNSSIYENSVNRSDFRSDSLDNSLTEEVSERRSDSNKRRTSRDKSSLEERSERWSNSNQRRSDYSLTDVRSERRSDSSERRTRDYSLPDDRSERRSDSTERRTRDHSLTEERSEKRSDSSERHTREYSTNGRSERSDSSERRTFSQDNSLTDERSERRSDSTERRTRDHSSTEERSEKRSNSSERRTRDYSLTDDGSERRSDSNERHTQEYSLTDDRSERRWDSSERCSQNNSSSGKRSYSSKCRTSRDHSSSERRSYSSERRTRDYSSTEFSGKRSDVSERYTSRDNSSAGEHSEKMADSRESRSPRDYSSEEKRSESYSRESDRVWRSRSSGSSGSVGSFKKNPTGHKTSSLK